MLGRLIFCALALYAWDARADIPLDISGFGTLALEHNGQRGADWRSTSEEGVGVGRSSDSSGAVASLFGIQADSQFSAKWHATFQVVDRELSNDSFAPYPEWANLRYSPSNDLHLRFGRISNNTFIMSESREVGYTRMMLNLPIIYVIDPIEYINGGDASYDLRVGDATYHINLIGGQSDLHLTYAAGVVHYHFQQVGANFSVNWHNHSWRLVYNQDRIDSSGPLLSLYESGIDQMSAAGVAGSSSIDDSMHFNGILGHFIGAGYTYDDGRWWVQSEAGHRAIASQLIQSLYGGYINVGRHWQNLALYTQYDHIHNSTGYTLPTLTSSNPLVALVNGVDSGLEQAQNINALSLGLRWDIKSNAALKFEYTYFIKPALSVGPFINATPNFYANSAHVQLLGTALDVIF